ncbi:DMT family transporter [Candidatus Woesearchaeota archaeon]|nr:DMT family transporter [Candidatus Woesearchaeota archaeon]
MALSEGILFGLTTLVGYGISDALSAIPARAIGVRKLIFFRNLFIAAALLILVLLFAEWPSPLPVPWLLFAIAIALFGYVPLATFYRGLQLGKVGIISPIAKSSLVITVLLAIIFLDEHMTFLQTIAFLFIFIGIILISIKFSDFRASELFSLRHGVPYALLSCFFWGIGFFLFKFLVNIFGPLITAFFIEGGVFIAGAASLFFSRERKRILQLPNARMLKYIITIAVATTIGTTSYMFGISKAPVSIVTALAFSNPFLTVLYGAFVFKERLRPLQYIAIVLIISGIVMMSI